jgi:hypothetical protein
MAFSGDADALWRPFPLLNSLIRENLDYFVFLGDLIYEWEEGPDTASAEDLADFRFKYRENREPRPGSPSQMVPMLDLYRSFGQYSIFDNHELAYSQADRSAPPYVSGGAQRNGQFVNQTPGFNDRIQAYTEYQPVRLEEVAGTGDSRMDGTRKFYRTISWGANVQLIILDDRSYRDEQLATTQHPQAASCARTILGAPQLQWFENELRSAQARNVVWKVVVVSSPIPQLGPLDAPKSWAGGYACERDRVLKFIDDNAIDNVVFLTTDYHYTAINTLKYNTDPEDQTSPLKSARNSFEVMTGPLGAFSDPSFQADLLGVDVTGLPGRDADRAILHVWNATLEDFGLDPIGLPADFPGLVASSVRAQSVSPGVVEPLAFASLGTLTYAVLAFDRSTLAVEVKGMEAVFDWPLLLNPQIEQEYENRQAEQILRFEIMAQ